MKEIYLTNSVVMDCGLKRPLSLIESFEIYFLDKDNKIRRKGITVEHLRQEDFGQVRERLLKNTNDRVIAVGHYYTAEDKNDFLAGLWINETYVRRIMPTLSQGAEIGKYPPHVEVAFIGIDGAEYDRDYTHISGQEGYVCGFRKYHSKGFDRIEPRNFHTVTIQDVIGEHQMWEEIFGPQ